MPMNNPLSPADLANAKVNLETSTIAWSELMRFFAGGLTIAIAKDLDLIEVASQFSKDNTAQVEQWMMTNKVSKVSDQQAQDWLDSEAIVWTVVVKPWILVQVV